MFPYSWSSGIPLDYWLSGCCYPRRCVFVHNKRPQFEIAQPQEQVERWPWRDRRKSFKEELERKQWMCGDSASVILSDVSSQLKPNIKYYRILCSDWYFSRNRAGDTPPLVTDRQEGQLVGRPLWLRRSRPVPLAECSESGNRRWRSQLLRRHLRRETAPVCRTAHTHADTVHALGVILWRVLPATSRLDNSSHFEYPMKYMKLPEYKYKLKSKGFSSVRQTCPASFSAILIFSTDIRGFQKMNPNVVFEL